MNTVRLAFRLIGAGALGFVVACGAVEEPNNSLSQSHSAGTQAQGTQAQGTQAQGTQAQGTQAQGVSMNGTEFDERGMYFHSQYKRGATLQDGTPLDELVVVQGQLIGKVYADGVPGGSSAYPCKETSYGVYRNCGWTVKNVGSCKPGTYVRVGATDSTACKSPLGSSSGNAMLRVCEGGKGCDYSRYSIPLAQNDDACGYEPSVSFYCPASGYFTVMTAPYSSASLKWSATPAASGQSVTYPIAKYYTGEQLKGAVILADEFLPDGTMGVIGFSYRITSVTPETEPLPEGYTTSYPEGTTYLYGLEHELKEGTWVTSCGEDGSAVSAAIPTDGTWNASGDKVASAKYFTFACTSGVMGKCYRWGYRPWVNSNFWNHHWTCTRMARADYCGDGYSWTKDGTTINFSDRMAVPVQKMSGDAAYTEPGGFYFEAGWQTDGARCLSHYRWYDLPEGFAADRCQDQLRDPTFPEYSFAAGKYGPTICDTESEAVTKFGTAMHDLSQCNGYAGGCADITW